MKSETHISDKELELISRSLDEELSELEKRRLSQKILSKDTGAQVWSRYHAVSAVMRKQFPARLDKEFNIRVMQEIERDGRQHEAPKKSGIHRAKSTVKHVAGLAVAASVAAVSVISYQYFNKPVTDPNPATFSSATSTEQIQVTPATTVPSLPVEFTPAQLNDQDQEIISIPEVES